ncbi:nucleotidyltransferase domain-containing protein [Argonema antarcticum A004/B2]|nr:nucleotidyltransferase domain-containing protein [Argonema antarcticum A004/B2]
MIEFAVFGSVLRSYFRSDSDIDVLVTFAPSAKRGLTETLQMQDELKSMFHRKVDFIVKTALASLLARLRFKSKANSERALTWTCVSDRIWMKLKKMRSLLNARNVVQSLKQAIFVKD